VLTDVDTEIASSPEIRMKIRGEPISCIVVVSFN